GLWIAFRPMGLGLIKDGKFTSYTKPEDVPAPEVFVLACDQDGRVWAGTQHGLSFRDDAGWHQVGPEWNIPQVRAWSLFTDPRGTLWVGTETEVYSLARGSRSFTREEGGLTTVTSIAQAKDGRVWVAQGGDYYPRPLGASAGFKPTGLAW